ncbi:NADP-dependent malic enzyme [Corynebacterium sp. TAE3-ERU12]|uniref:NAD(P)-dependent malic enzyme n=1 Tax=Corynebacterium sp. TAE3-ERU12 TaxID=2849491 RepID=UPI001C45110E|nr:NADP-dependent malic enzyme [Corynebacterium sp. TAE3-ERU12]MBV7296149.1 NADP-dependent malic enzyme [Corynebacterium sp. TAE3-ERU12]
MTTAKAGAITDEEIFRAHEGGKLITASTLPLDSTRDLSIAYTPGVARVCEAIHEDESLARKYTWTGHNVAIITDGTAVLGLGDIGPKAGMPVMEGKAQLFGRFAGINAIPLALDTTDTDELVETIARLAPSFGGINLEDIAAPRCFEIERRLDEMLDIPIFHDDQHGTAIVITAGLRNACKLTGKHLEDLKVVISGAGAAGMATARMLLAAGVRNIVLCDSRGIIHQGRSPMNESKQAIAEITNPKGLKGEIRTALEGADTFIGVSAGHLGEEDIRVMDKDPFLFSLANPNPEIPQELALKYGAVVATGRSDHPNQINNVLAFPGIFKGALNAGAKRITRNMKLAATRAIAEVVADDLSPDRIVPSPLDPAVAPAVTAAVEIAARNDHNSGAPQPAADDK